MKACVLIAALALSGCGTVYAIDRTMTEGVKTVTAPKPAPAAPQSSPELPPLK